MEILEQFWESFSKMSPPDETDFSLTAYKKDCYIGIDNNFNTVLVVKSPTPKAQAIKYNTKMLSIECNVNVDFLLEGQVVHDAAHILRCLSVTPEDRKLFLEIAALFVEESDYREEGFIGVFQVLSDFFMKPSELGDFELRGLYAELLTILDFEDKEKLSSYWHSKNCMKFDFSISEKFKIEIKSTVRPERIHHFNNDQLCSKGQEVFVFSYMLREDDRGLSLFELIDICKSFCVEKEQQALLIWYQTRVSEDRLKAMKFSKTFATENRRIFRAIDIPHIDGCSVPSLSGINYDCLLDGVPAVELEFFLQKFSEALEPQDINYYGIGY